jgi:2-dehydro-3-deoxy-D-gluconate 5-dehydrogenase
MILDAFQLNGKNALVTGSRRGLGADIALALADAGANVACHGRGDDSNQISTRIRSWGRKSIYVSGDVAEKSVCEELVEKTVVTFGSIDILVNNAGVIRRSPALEHSEENWDEVIAVKLAARQMMEKKRGGKIVSIASILSFQGGVLVPAYAAAKGGIAQLTKALANEWASKGINVNAIAPGYMVTDNTTALREDANRNRQILERIPAGRWGEPSDLAGAAIYLCSAASNYVHGHVLSVDGGWLSR